MTWWDDERIQSTVTRDFVCAQLRPHEVDQLDRTLGFGDGLTSETYWEWINQKAKKIFLILVDLSIPGRIFNVIDDSWDDNDLPIGPDHVERLPLSVSPDETLWKLFYFRQFQYLLKPLRKGVHLTYQDMDIVPIDIVNRRQGSAQEYPTEKVRLYNEPDRVFSRRTILLGPEHGLASEDFQDEIEQIRPVENDHLVSYWASYTHRNKGYVLFTPVADLTLKSVLANIPASMKALEKADRRRLVLNWIHCLVDTLCFLHSKGLAHGNIRPSTILVDDKNQIFYSGISKLSSRHVLGDGEEKSGFDKESYDYAAPETPSRTSVSSSASSRSRQNTLTSSTAAASDYTFSISRRDSSYQSPPPSATVPRVPYFGTQQTDIFRLGCVILELVNLLVKRSTKSFAAHRAAKHKTPGRGGAVPDSSFHRNLGQVESWMVAVAKEAAVKKKKKDGDPTLNGVAQTLQLVERMLAVHPADRPSAHDVQTRMYDIMTGACGIAEPHCVHQYIDWPFNMASPQAPLSPDAMSIAGSSSSSSQRSSEYSRFGRGSNAGLSGETGASNSRKGKGPWLDPVYMGVAGRIASPRDVNTSF